MTAKTIESKTYRAANSLQTVADSVHPPAQGWGQTYSNITTSRTEGDNALHLNELKIHAFTVWSSAHSQSSITVKQYR